SSTPLPYPLSLHDALPISAYRNNLRALQVWRSARLRPGSLQALHVHLDCVGRTGSLPRGFVTRDSRARIRSPRGLAVDDLAHWRSEEHTSELQSPYDLVCS